MLSKIIRRSALSLLRRKGGTTAIKVDHDHHDQHHDEHHDHHHYDWRADPLANPDMNSMWFNRGNPDPRYYHYPFEGKAESSTGLLPFPSDYNPKDLSKNLDLVNSTPKLPVKFTMLVGDANMQADINHQFSYESQDFDFQPQSTHSQHFRKRNHSFLYIIIGLSPLWYYYFQMVVEELPDKDTFKLKKPPPYNYPNNKDTPDDWMIKVWDSPYFKRLYQEGRVQPPYFKIENGRKVYFPTSGASQPMQNL